MLSSKLLDGRLYPVADGWVERMGELWLLGTEVLPPQEQKAPHYNLSGATLTSWSLENVHEQRHQRVRETQK